MSNDGDLTGVRGRRNDSRLTGAAYIPYFSGLFPGTANVPGYRWLSRAHCNSHGSRWTQPGICSYSGREALGFDRDLPDRPTSYVTIF